MLKKILFTIAILTVLSFQILFAQNSFQQKTDSLIIVVQSAKKQNNSALEKDALVKLSNQYEYGGDWNNYNTTIELMVALAEKHNDIEFKAECYNKLGISNCYQGNNQIAIDFFNKALAINNNNKDSMAISNSYENIAMVCKDMGNYNKAVEFQIKSIELRKGTYHKRIFNNYMALTILYGLMKDTDKQNVYIALAKETLENKPNKDYSQLAIFNNELGELYNKNNLADSAISCYKNVIKFSEKIDWKRGVAVGKGNLAEAYAEKGMNRLAINMHYDVLNLSIEIDDCMGIAEEYLYIADIYRKLNKIDSAIYLSNQSLEKAQECSLAKEHINALGLSSDLYEMKGNYKMALLRFKEFKALNDSIFNLESQSNIADMETKYQSKEQQQQIELLNTQNEISEKQKANQRRFFIIVALSLTLLSIAFYYLFKNNQKTSKELKKLNDIKSSFFSNVSHELRTPLTLIGGPAASLLKDETDSTKKQHLELIQRNSQKLLTLVNQLLDLSKIDAGFYSLNASEDDLALITKKIISEFEYLAQLKNITYNSKLPDQIKCFFDSQVVETILTNLLSNAFKYVNESKNVSFELTISDEKAHFCIKNSCDPVSDEKITKMFDRFYRSDSLEIGTGIGLALVKELIGINRASINAHYNKSGEMQFDITLPISKNHFTKEELIAQPSIQSVSNARDFLVPNVFDTMDYEHENSLPTLLVVEDNTDMRKYINSCFTDNYTILEAIDGLEGVELASKHLPDIIISDVMMPKLDGIGLCHELKSNQSTSHIPIILLTAKAGDENTLIGLQNKADDYITKPFSSDNLVQKVKNALEHSLRMRHKYSQELMIKPLDLIFPSSEEQFAKNIQTVLNSHLTNPEFNVEQFCEATNLSRTQLHRKLTSLTGLSATAFIRTQRVKLAAEKLKSENCNITDVCYMVGFNDPSYFSKCFKEIIGETPTEYQLQVADKQ